MTEGASPPRSLNLSKWRAHYAWSDTLLKLPRRRRLVDRASCLMELPPLISRVYLAEVLMALCGAGAIVCTALLL